MLRLKNVVKTYAESTEGAVEALKGVSLAFRPNEFVSILGPSGCGKTTLLNIIGGLDRYSSGDLIINGTSTKEYKDNDWDTYRNHSIGFVFQSYNLIPHLTILENVELSMTLGGISKVERRERAKNALISVGLVKKLNKLPNELSGGQMQRVSIARALACEPDIILADEPTGALDTETSETVMELLKEISKTKLVIMVTHNPDLANRYSDRIIKMLDGNIIDDSKVYNPDKEFIDNSIAKVKQYKKEHSSMSLLTAIKLSWRNLLSKKRRTIITSLAASIGIIGIAVILSVSTGMQNYIDKTMLDSTSFNYIAINSTTPVMDFESGNPGIDNNKNLIEYPENTTGIYPYKEQFLSTKKQKLDTDFIKYLENTCYPTSGNSLVVDITYAYNVEMNILTLNGDNYVPVNSSVWNETLSNIDYLQQYYTVLAKDSSSTSAIPSNATEVALVVDKYNRLSTNTLDALGILYDKEKLSEIKYSDLIGKEFRVVFNDGWYSAEETNNLTIYRPANATNYRKAYESEAGITVKIISVLRENADAPASWLSEGVAYSPKLTQEIMKNNQSSKVALAQYENELIDVTTGLPFNNDSLGGLGGIIGNTITYEAMLEKLGYTNTPSAIMIYPTDVNNREVIIKALDAWNSENYDNDKKIEYIDMSSMVTSMLGTIVDVITYVLMAFSITSLVISSIMIAIIIYASVIERTKEIGVLRSIGARQKDVSRVFKAEAGILGFISGTAAIIITLILNVLINAILGNLVGVTTIANLTIFTAISLIALSIVLLLIASLIPAKIASKRIRQLP